MPPIRESILESVFYLYPSRETAEAGERLGGTGFFVSVDSTLTPHRWFVYLVTNSHSVIGREPRFARFNLKDGETRIYEIESGAWHHHPDGDDLAICPIMDHDLKQKWINTSLFLTKRIMAVENIGPGDDVYMIGRFMPHSGIELNLPVARFGTIAMKPSEPIVRPSDGFKQESFLVELRSLPGCSGSPVFVYLAPYFPRELKGGKVIVTPVAPEGPWLLGVDWCHLHDYQEVLDSDRRPTDEGLTVKMNSGMAGVIPAWKLMELLEMEHIAKGRLEHEQKIIEEKETIPGGSVS